MVRTWTKRTTRVRRFGELNAALTAVQSSLSRATLHARIHHFVPACASCSHTDMSRDDDSVEIQRQPLVDLPRERTGIQMRSPLITDHTALAFVVLLLATIILPALCSSQELGHWWSDPCDKLRKVRHQGSQQVLTQLNNVISNLNKHQLPQVKHIFKMVSFIQLMKQKKIILYFIK